MTATAVADERAGDWVPATDTGTGRSAAYLQQLTWMEQEIKTAMLAVATNSVQALELSLTKQEVLCISLTRLVSSFSTPDLDGSILQQVKEATISLSSLNKTYSALLRQSQASTTLFYKLCLSYRGSDANQTLAAATPNCTLEA